MNLRSLFRKMTHRPKAPGFPLFAELAAQYAARLRRQGAPRRGSGVRVGVLITPWMFTAVPFFSLECAGVLAESGLEVTLLWDRSNVVFNAAKQREIDAVAALVAQVAPWFRVIDVSALPGRLPANADFLPELLYENAVRRQRGEQYAAQFLDSNAQITEAMREHAGRIEALLAAEDFDWLLIPGGIWAVSGLYSHLAQARGLSYTTFDSGVGQLFLAHDGVAAHFADVPHTYKTVAATVTAEKRRAMIDRAHAELRERMAGRDVFRLQPKPAGGTDAMALDCDLLVPLNYRSDSAALCRHRLFVSVTDWLEQLLGWLQTQERGSVAIRQHPCERIPEYRGSDRWPAVFAPFAGLGARLRFVAAEDPVNTYDLMARARAVLPFTSRVGIEAAMLGLPVILATHCYYEDCGFAHRAATREEYFTLIAAALRGELRPDTAAREAAAMVYFLAECCLVLPTRLTPQPKDFVEWVNTPRAELWAVPENQDLLAALLTREPLLSIRHRRLTGSAEALPGDALV